MILSTFLEEYENGISDVSFLSPVVLLSEVFTFDHKSYENFHTSLLIYSHQNLYQYLSILFEKERVYKIWILFTGKLFPEDFFFALSYEKDM